MVSRSRNRSCNRARRLPAALSALALIAAPAVAVPLAATPALAASAPAAAAPPSSPEISEIAYARADSSDFIEIAAPTGTDLSSWTVGSVARGGSVSATANVTTVPAGTTVGDSGSTAVRVAITNSVSAGNAADGLYGASAFAIDAKGTLVDFEQIGGTAGGKGVTGVKSSLTPEAVVGKDATPTWAASGKGQSIARAYADGSGSGTSWSAGAPTPGSLGGAATDPTDDPTDTPAPGDDTPIATIQGTGDTSPLAGTTATTTGVVTAAYPSGGLAGYYIQTAGSGGATDATPGKSDGIFVYSPDTVKKVKTGDSVRVSGTVSEYYGQTQLTVKTGGLAVLDDPAAAPKPVESAFPEDPEKREALEGMLVQPTGHVTVADDYGTNTYGEIALVNGRSTLRQPTDVARPGSAAAKKLAADNARRAYVLDDGGTVDFTKGATDTPVPYLSNEKPVRVGAPVTFTAPMVVGYGHDAWRLQPTQYLGAGGDAPATFGNTRRRTPQEVGGRFSIASFNVLNYFPTTGDQLSGCTFYYDRAGNPTTVKDGCDARGAANQAQFTRQQAKIVAAINRIDTSVLSLEEIEDSSRFGKDRDDALAKLVTALNTQAGEQKWDYVRSPATLPKNGIDVIRTAFIYQPAQVRPVGGSTLLDDAAFANARAPLAQAFAPATASTTAGKSAKASAGNATAARADQAEQSSDQTFLAIVNHFKSKGSGSGAGNEDTGDGQGASNADRVKQAKALVSFADEQKAEAATDDVVLLGDLNSYTEEDPMQVLYDAGYADIGKEQGAGDTYLFDGLTGSLDHVLGSRSFTANVAGAHVWNINSVESVGLEYSRFNANARNLYDDSPFRASDHDPLIAGFDLDPAGPTDGPTASATPDPTSSTGEAGAGSAANGASAGGGSGPDGGAGSDASGDASGSAGGDDNAEGPGAGSLPITGASLIAAAAGLALIAAGAAVMLVARKRRN